MSRRITISSDLEAFTVGEHTFRRLPKDETLAEPVVFEMGQSGRPVRLVWHQNYFKRIR